MSNPTILAIDPGMYGALVGIYDNGEVEMEIMPLSKHKTVDAIRAGEFVDQLSHTDIIIVWESVHAMPNQGVSSTFKFGLNTGWVVGAVISRASCNGAFVAEKKVRPQEWKKHFGLIKQPKDAAIDVMKDLLPDHDFSNYNKKQLSGIADAYLLGRYYKETQL